MYFDTHAAADARLVELGFTARTYPSGETLYSKMSRVDPFYGAYPAPAIACIQPLHVAEQYGGGTIFDIRFL
jgi:hypothetical protein